MFTLKPLVILFILQNIVSSYCWEYEYICNDSEDLSASEYSCDSNEEQLKYTIDNSNEISTDNEEEITSENPGKYSTENPVMTMTTNEKSDINNNESPENESNVKITCPKGHSMISEDDIKYLIEDHTEILRIIQNFVNSSYPEAEKLFIKHMDELQDFLERFLDRPDHMLHILHDMAALRQKIEPAVEEIESQLEQFNTLEVNLYAVAERAYVKLNQFEENRNICEQSCPLIEIRNRFGPNNINNPVLVSHSSGTYCIRLKHLNDIINEKLSEVQAQHHEDLYEQLEFNDKMYTQLITEFKQNLKNAAVHDFGMIMYEILSLQDDYHHFIQYLEDVNIASAIYNIKMNTAEINYMLIGLEQDLENYQQYCLKCFMNKKIKPKVFDYLDVSLPHDVQPRFLSSEDEISDVETVVIELIKEKILEIRESIKGNLTSMFEELDRKLKYSEVIDSYISQMHPIRSKIENDVKLEQNAFYELRSRVAQESIEKILALSEKSYKMIQELVNTKQFFDQFTSK